MFSGLGYYWIAVANVVDGAVAFAAPAATARPKLRVIQGGKY
jgi:hypothetical protein